MLRYLTQFIAFLMLLICVETTAQYQMENLDRGVVAINRGNNNLVSWRLFGTDPGNIAFNLYRDGNLVNGSPITDRTNYRDNGANAGASYFIRPIINGVEEGQSKTVGTWGDQFLRIPLNRPAGGSNESGNYEYMPYDASVGDLDGDGEYEIVFKWDPTNAKDNSQSGHTGDVYLEAVKLDGTSMWRLNLGRNIRAGAHYTQFMVYDFDGDGRAEVMCKTAPGTRDGSGSYLSEGPAANDNDGADYANSGGYVLSGPEYLTVFNGLNGEEITTVNYVPARGNVNSWGDGYGNRVDRFLAGVAYLNGQTPSAVFCRGYYTRTVLAAWDFDGQNLTQRWIFDTNNGMRNLEGKGNHQLSIADLDNDGRQEIIYGAIAIDDDGSVLHSQTWWHGDALHVGDFDLDNPGVEIYMPTETAQANPANGRPAVVMRDGDSGDILWATYRDGDIGRGICTNIDSRYPGAECWGSGGQGLFDSKGNNIGSIPGGVNFTIWWDGDLERELLDEEKLDDYNNGNQSRQYTIYNDGADAINGSKANPNLQADILGDWREELIYRSYTNDALLVFTTDFETDYRIPTLMHDPQYRMAVAWQNVAYNQPPHPSFYLGSDRSPDVQLPPITTVGGTPPEPDCNGTIGGTAYLDDCERCVGGSTGNLPCSSIDEGYYEINAAHTGFCLQNNNPVTQEVCTEASNQIWQVIKNGDYYQLRSLASGLYMSGGSNTQEQNTGMSNDPVDLILSDAPNGNYYIAPAADPSLVFDVFAVSPDAGERLILWVNTNATNQHFTFAPAAVNTDCNGDIDGSAYVDECGTCVGGNTGNIACIQDCNGEWGGTATVDDCDVCSGGSTGIEANETCTDCNGDINGSAYTDDCGRCVGGNSNNESSCYTILEIEDVCTIDGVVEAINGGFSGSGYANTSNEAGSEISFVIQSADAGTHSILFRYANGSANNRSMSVWVNGNEQIAELDFNTTGDWTTWEYQAVEIILNEGLNEITLSSNTAEGGPNFDQLYGASGYIIDGNCTLITGIDELKGSGLAIFPNPFSETITVNSDSRVRYEVYTLNSEKLEEGTFEGTTHLGSDLPTGTYMLVLDKDGKVFTLKIVKE